MTAITKSKDVETISVDELVGFLQSYESNLPKTSKSKSMALKSVDGVDDSRFDYEISSVEIAHLAKNFRNFLRNNNRRARNQNNADPKNVKKNETTKNNVFKKSKDKVFQSSNSVLVVKGMVMLNLNVPHFLGQRVKLWLLLLVMMKELITSLKVIKKEIS